MFQHWCGVFVLCLKTVVFLGREQESWPCRYWPGFRNFSGPLTVVIHRAFELSPDLCDLSTLLLLLRNFSLEKPETAFGMTANMTSPECKRTRRTRFVCISDTHNTSPATGAFKLPRGDVLVHAGDLTNQGTLSELQRTVNWIEQADFEAKIVIAGMRTL